MARFFQWVATSTDILVILGETPRVGAFSEVIPSSQGRGDFWVVEKLRGPGAGIGYERLDVKAFLVTEQQIRNFLTNQGETVPAQIELFVRPSARGGLVNDEVVIVDASQTITRL